MSRGCADNVHICKWPGPTLGLEQADDTARPPSTCPPEWCEGDEPDPSDGEIWEAMNAQAPRLTALAGSFGLTIMALQPLNQFDGWPEGCKRAEWVRRKAERWLPLCAQLGVELLQVCNRLLLNSG